jgi:hypothetical protein
MAGQGRNADGLTGSQPRDALNVVRFPGDWFGPLGDLVPIGTDADTEQDEPDLYVDEPAGLGADSFWGEDAEEVHRVATPTPVSRPGRGSPRSRLLLPLGALGGVAAAAVAVVVVLGSGTHVGKPGRVSHGRPPQLAVAHLATEPSAKATTRPTRPAKPAQPDRNHANRATTVRPDAKRRSAVSAGGLPHVNVAVRTVDTDVAANVTTGDVVTADVTAPTGLVSPPPNATQLTP